jgi:regulator of sirC expression with transglutaminase-like and TPR domain
MLMLARIARPDLDAAKVTTQLDRMAQRCRDLIVEPASLRSKCRVINRVLFHEVGLRGNAENYTDPDNSFLDQVLARRCGIPISLCTVYLLVAQRLGLALEPIALPGHFMLGCFAEEPPFFIDAFDGGVFRPPEEIYVFLWSNELPPHLSTLTPTPVHEVLCRSCRNLATHYESCGDIPHAQLFDHFITEFEALSTRPPA